MYSQDAVLDIIQAYKPETQEEKEAQSFIAEFIKQNPRYWSRSTPTAHLTGSAWITNTEKTKAVMLHHKKLDMWVQPGGHVDDEDSSLLAAAKREAEEETGLLDLTERRAGVFDLDIHKIPARKNEPEHLHLDVRFWFVADELQLNVNDESNDVVWLTRSQIEEKTQEESVLKMVRKSNI